LDGEALALLLSGEGAMTFSRTVGPCLPSVSNIFNEGMSSRSLCLEPVHDGVQGSDNHINQHLDPTSEAHIALICIACTITL